MTLNIIIIPIIEDECRLVEILNNTINQSEVEIEVLDKDSSFILPEFPESVRSIEFFVFNFKKKVEYYS